MTTLNRERELQDAVDIDQVPDGFEPVSATELNAWRRGFTPKPRSGTAGWQWWACLWAYRCC